MILSNTAITSGILSGKESRRILVGVETVAVGNASGDFRQWRRGPLQCSTECLFTFSWAARTVASHPHITTRLCATTLHHPCQAPFLATPFALLYFRPLPATHPRPRMAARVVRSVRSVQPTGNRKENGTCLFHFCFFALLLFSQLLLFDDFYFLQPSPFIHSSNCQYSSCKSTEIPHRLATAPQRQFRFRLLYFLPFQRSKVQFDLLKQQSMSTS